MGWVIAKYLRVTGNTGHAFSKIPRAGLGRLKKAKYPPVRENVTTGQELNIQGSK